MRALLVVDEPNDPYLRGRLEALDGVRERVAEARRENRPIAWIGDRSENPFFEAFDGRLEEWLRERDVTEVLIVGFYAHMSVSTIARQALLSGFAVAIDPDAIAARAIERPALGRQNADDVRLSALLHLTTLGVTISTLPEKAITLDWLDGRRQERTRSWS